MPTAVATIPDSRSLPRLPKSLAEFIKFCENHSEVITTRDDALKQDFWRATDRLFTECLGGRTEVPLSDLVPLLDSSHKYWGLVANAIEHGLKREDLLPEDYCYLAAGVGP